MSGSRSNWNLSNNNSVRLQIFSKCVYASSGGAESSSMVAVRGWLFPSLRSSSHCKAQVVMLPKSQQAMQLVTLVQRTHRRRLASAHLTSPPETSVLRLVVDPSSCLCNDLTGDRTCRTLPSVRITLIISMLIGLTELVSSSRRRSSATSRGATDHRWHERLLRMCLLWSPRHTVRP